MSTSPVEKTPYPEHPNRCQAVNSQGQCPNLGVRLEPGHYGPYCMAHGGNQAAKSHKATGLRNYRLTLARFQRQLDEKAESQDIKSLRDEIAILRLVLEERLNTCKDPMDLILQSGSIASLVLNIERVVSSCHKLEGSMGQLLDKQAILQFAQLVIGVVSEEITDESQVNRIADRLLAAVGDMGNAL